MELGYLAMSQVKQIHRNAINAVSRHNMRNDSENWSTAHIDKSRSRFNTILIGLNTADDIHDDIAGCDMMRNGKNPALDAIAAEFVIAPSKEWLQSLIGDDLKLTTPEANQVLFSNETFLNWLIEVKKALKAERCINAVLHVDESVPHIHAVCSVKLERKSKAKSEKTKRRSKKSPFVLSFFHYYGTSGEDYFLGKSKGQKREALEKKYGKKYDSTQTPLGQLQTRIWQKIGEPFGMKRGVAASTTGIKAKSVDQWRKEQKKKEIEAQNTKEIEEFKIQANKKKDEAKLKIENDLKESKKKNEEEAEKKLKEYKNAQLAWLENEKDNVYAQLLEITNQIKKNAENELKEYNDLVQAKVAENKKATDKEAERCLKEYSKIQSQWLENEKNNINNHTIKAAAKIKENAEIELKEYNDLVHAKVIENKKNVEEEAKKELKEYNNSIKAKIFEYKNKLLELFNELEKLASSLGFVLKEVNVLKKLTEFKKQFLADGRFQVGRRMQAIRNNAAKNLTQTEKHTENVIQTIQKIEDMRM